MKKTLFVGLDAACWEYLGPVIARGDMPMLESLQREGLWGDIDSTLPAHTPTAWASIVTGKNPGKHAIFDHVTRRLDTYEFIPVSSTHRVGTPIWRRLNEQGVRVGLVNVPFSHPPDPIDGFALCGFGAPDTSDRLAYPQEILVQIESEFGRYEPVVQPEVLRNSAPDAIYEAERRHQRQLVRIATYLANKHAVEALVINLMLLDHANHKMPSMKSVERALADCDLDLKWLIDQFRPDNVVLFSDHGSRRVRGVFLLDAWLRDHGLCHQQLRTPQERSNAVNWILVQRERNRAEDGALSSRANRWFSRQLITRLPERLLHTVWSGIESEIPFARENARYRPELDYRKSSVYFGGTFSGLLYLNKSGRESAGILSSAEAEKVVQDLRSSLLEVQDPQLPRPLLAGVHRPEELYSGPAVSSAPDIILDTYEASCNIATNFARGAKATGRMSRYFLEDSSEFGHHSKTGMFVLTGPPFKRGQAAKRPTVTDLAPLLLTLYNTPIPDDFDGQLPTDLLNTDFLHRNPTSFQEGDSEEKLPDGDAYSAEEANQVLEHLRALGYLD